MNDLSDIQAALKGATAALHADVERQPCFSRLMMADVTVADVVRAISVLHAHHAMWEPALESALSGIAPHGFLARRARLPALQADLTRHAVIARAPADPRAGLGVDEAMGWLYVHDGARHGALVIRKHLARCLGETVANRFSAFSGSGKDVAEMWAETRGLIAQCIQTEDQLRRAVAGAQSAFAALNTCAARDGAREAVALAG